MGTSKAKQAERKALFRACCARRIYAQNECAAGKGAHPARGLPNCEWQKVAYPQSDCAFLVAGFVTFLVSCRLLPLLKNTFNFPFFRFSPGDVSANGGFASGLACFLRTWAQLDSARDMFDQATQVKQSARQRRGHCGS